MRHDDRLKALMVGREYQVITIVQTMVKKYLMKLFFPLKNVTVQGQIEEPEP